MESAIATTTTPGLKWPADPYKGLTYYGPDDIPLFAGRNADVRKVARILGAGATRILLLHGSTGCGKSSFIRAALIPFLEHQVGRFAFAREAGATAEAALFVRSSHDPLVELASKAWEYAKAHEEQFPVPASSAASDVDSEGFAPNSEATGYATGPILDFTKYSTIAKFTAAVSDDPERLVDVIGRIAYRRPRTQALVVDQAEEVLTLKPGAEGEDARRRFFMFLTYLSHSAINFRLLVVFRTEYHGRFYASLKSAAIDASSLEDYYLSDLSGHDLLDAITRPTSTDEIPGYGIPREYYRFYYDEGVAETIARDLESARLVSGTLPVLQIVCRRLHQKVMTSEKVNGYWVIRQKDYKDLGGIQGQVDSHLQQALEKGCEELKTSKLLVANLESIRWRDVLAELAKPQADGTVTTDVKPARALSELAELSGCTLPFDKTMEFLKRDEWKIVRPVELTRPNGEKVPCYSLGHDVLGAVLEDWKANRKVDRREVRGWLVMWGIGLMILSLAVNSEGITNALRFIGWNQPQTVTRMLLWALGLSSLAIAAIPNVHAFSFIYRPIYGFLTDLNGVRRLPGARPNSAPRS